MLKIIKMESNSKEHFYYLVPIFLGLIFWLTAGILFPQPTDSANLTSVKDTLSSSRLSYYGDVDEGNTDEGSSLVIVDSTPAISGANSTTNFNVFSGDTIQVGDKTDYTVVDVINDASDNKIQVNPVIETGDADGADDAIIIKRKAQHVVDFTPVSVINDGYFRVRIKSTGAGSTDGVPDPDGFDFTSGFNTDWITCNDIGTTAVATVEYNNDTHCSDGWTCVLCQYGGSNTTSSKSIEIGTTASDQQPINPSPDGSGSVGEADTYNFYVDHLDSSGNIMDSTQGKIAVVESVRVTAVVEPTIEFEIDGVAVGTSACGVATDVGTSAPYVAFGSLETSNFIDAAQKLKAATNATSGYSVTAEESNEMRLIGATGPVVGTTIPDTTCDGGTCTASTNVGWTAATNNGFGYSLANVTGTPATFLYSEGSSGFSAKHFSNIGAGETAHEIMSSNIPATTEEAYVCYRITIGATQEPGTYTNDVTYIATANF